MAHRITFHYDIPANRCILSESEIRDLIELLYRWGDSTFLIIFKDKHKRWRGSAQWKFLEHMHEVTLYCENIKKDFQTKSVIAGSQPAPSLKAAAAMVLAHELQHCNQVKLHKQDARSSFYGGHQYWNLASEREARGFVDERMNEICAYFGLPPAMRQAVAKAGTDEGELAAVISLLSECDSVSPEDINDELRVSNLLSPVNVSAVRRGLQALGVEIKKKDRLYS